MTKKSVTKLKKMLEDLAVLADRMNTVDLFKDEGGFNIFDDSLNGISKPIPPDGISASSIKWVEFVSAKNVFVECCLKIVNEEKDYVETLNQYVQILDRICVTEPSYYGAWVSINTIDQINTEIRKMQRELRYVDYDIIEQEDKPPQNRNTSLNIGSNNTIQNMVINQNSSVHSNISNKDNNSDESYVNKHPFIAGIGASLIAATIWALFNCENIVFFVKGFIK